MSDLQLSIDGTSVEEAAGWAFSWIDRAAGIGRLAGASGSETCLVEGSGSDWVVTLRGRRIGVSVRSWRERALADAESVSRQVGGPVEIRATLPGLVVTVLVQQGDEVTEGATLLTIEAMKMQNEVRSPRAGRVSAVSVAVGRKVVAGTSLLRIE